MSTIGRFDFGVNAASGLTLQMARTWSPWLPRDPRLLVPVHLDVLVVRSTGGTWAETALRASDAGGFTQPPPFTDRPAPRGRGAYLLWAPPDALARGSKPRDDPNGPIRFAPLPERWLVLRLSPSRAVAGRRTVRGWVVKADEPGSAPVPLDQYVDAIEPLDGQAQGEPVTVVGPGQLDWVGYFDNVENRFGFHDPLDDVAAGPIAYLVCGWYRDPDRDRLADPDIRTEADFKHVLDELRWHLPDSLFKQAQARSTNQSQALDKLGLTVQRSVKQALRGSTTVSATGGSVEQSVKLANEKVHAAMARWWPRLSLFHGAVVGIGWPNAALDERGAALLGGEAGGPPSASAVRVGFGNTLTDALSSMVARRDGHPEHARLLQAFQLGAMNELDEPDGRAKVDALLHATTFASLPGGTATERVWQPPLGEPPAPGTAQQPGPGVFERYYRRDKGGTRTNLKQGAALGTKASSARASSPVDEKRFFAVGAPNKPAAASRSAGGSFQSKVFAGKQLEAESLVVKGTAAAAIAALGGGVQRPPYRPGRWVDRERPLPRYYRPLDPVVVVEGIKRAWQHGGDGRFSTDGRLGCRLSGTGVKDMRVVELNRTLNGEDVLDRTIGNGSVPPECEDLLNELVLLDPGSSMPMVRSASAGLRMAPSLQRSHADTVLARQTAWWAARDPRVDASGIVSLAPFNGTLPSPVAINLPSRPWNPLHLEWRGEFIASPGAVADWTLGELDYNEDVPDLPPPGSVAPVVIEGRAPLAAGAGRTIAGAIRRSLAEALAQRANAQATVEVDSVPAFASQMAMQVSQAFSGLVAQTGGSALDAQERATLADIAAQLEQMDVLAAGLDGLHTQLRAGYLGDGEAKPADASVPPGFVSLRAGFLRVLRLRVVDAFGQVLDLAGSSAAQPADAARVQRSEPLEVTTRPELLALPPRLTSPARLWLRFTDAAGGPDEARDKTDQQDAVTPVCGYLMPNHLDDALLFYAGDGRDLGVVRRNEDDRIVWEDAPGAPSTVGASPSQAIANPFAAGIAQGLMDWGVQDAGLIAGLQPNDTALRALMRVIDTTRWTIDPFGHQGEEHLALLVGQPVVVVRAVLRLEVKEPVDPVAVNGLALPVRLGALAQWQDGLLGYFVNDDYRTIHCSEAAVAELARAFGPERGFLQAVEDVPDVAANLGEAAAADPIVHPYVDRSGVILMRPNQDVRLTLLLEPHTLVHATCGLLPRKEIGLRKEWTQDALAKLSPTFRFGPVLVDPKKVRMPVAADLHGTWSWDHRTDVTTWENLPVTHATQDALLPQDPPVASEGWLRLRPLDDESAPANQPPGGTP